MRLIGAFLEWVTTRFGSGSAVPAHGFEPWRDVVTRDPVWISARHCDLARQAVTNREAVHRGWNWDQAAIDQGRFVGQRAGIGPGDALLAQRRCATTFAEYFAGAPAG